MPPHTQLLLRKPRRLKAETLGFAPSPSRRSGLPAFARPQGARSRRGKDTARHRKGAERTRLLGYTRSISELRGTVLRRHLGPSTVTFTRRAHPQREAPSRLMIPSFSPRLRWKCQGRGWRAPLTPWNPGAGRVKTPHPSPTVLRPGQ